MQYLLTAKKEHPPLRKKVPVKLYLYPQQHLSQSSDKETQQPSATVTTGNIILHKQTQNTTRRPKRAVLLIIDCGISTSVATEADYAVCDISTCAATETDLVVCAIPTAQQPKQIALCVSFPAQQPKQISASGKRWASPGGPSGTEIVPPLRYRHMSLRHLRAQNSLCSTAQRVLTAVRWEQFCSYDNQRTGNQRYDLICSFADVAAAGRRNQHDFLSVDWNVFSQSLLRRVY